MLNPSANTCAQHRNPGEAICAELVLSWSYFFSLPSAFFSLGAKKHIQAA